MGVRGAMAIAAMLLALAGGGCDEAGKGKAPAAKAPGAWAAGQISTKVDPALLGRWERKIDSPQGPWTLTFEPDPAGRYRLSFDGPGYRPTEMGDFQAKDGRWSNKPDGGTEGGGAYRFDGPDKMVLEDGSPPHVSWTRAADAPTAAPADTAPDGVQKIGMTLRVGESLAEGKAILVLFLKDRETLAVPASMEPMLKGALVVHGQYGGTQDGDYARDMVRRFAVTSYPTWVVVRAVCRKDGKVAFVDFERLSGPPGGVVEETVTKALERARKASRLELVGRKLIDTAMTCEP